MKYKLIKSRKLLEDKSFFSKNKWFVGYNKENRAEVLEFEIPTSLNNYTKKINFELPNGNVFDLLENDNTYVLKNNITKYDKVRFYLEFTKEIEQNHIEVIKTEIKTIEFGDSFDVNEEIPQEDISIINTIITRAGDAITRANAIATDLENKRDTDYYRGAQGPQGIQGERGISGQDAKINGKNSIELLAGDNIELEETQNGYRINTLSDVVSDANYVHTDNNFTNTYKNNIEDNTQARHTHSNKSVLDNISSTDITNWNGKSDFSGSYNDLTDKPTIPDVSNFITKDVNDLTYYTLATNTGSTIELSINSSTYVITLNLKNSAGTVISTGTIDLPLESVVVSGSYDDTTKKIILTLQGGSTVEFSVADLVSGLQSEITVSNKLSSDLVDDTNNTNKFVTTSEKQTWNNKGEYSKPVGGIPSTDLSSAVQTSLSKADTALQSYTEQYTGTITSVKMNGTTISSSGEADLGTVITSHQDISGKQDVLIAGTNITIAADGKTISATDTTYSNATTSTAGLMSDTDKTKLDGIATGATANVGTITGITMNGASKGTSGVVDLGTVITSHQDISGKLDTSKVKNATSTTAGDVYDVRYINTMLGDIEILLGGI